jgi:hypothetical protein
MDAADQENSLQDIQRAKTCIIWKERDDRRTQNEHDPIVTEALADKEREVQMYLAYRRDEGDAQQAEADCYRVQPDETKKRKTRLTGDDRRTGKNLRQPHQLVAVDGVGGVKTRRLEEDKLATDGEKMQVPAGNGKENGDARADWERTRDERIRAPKKVRVSINPSHQGDHLTTERESHNYIK